MSKGSTRSSTVLVWLLAAALGLRLVTLPSLPYLDRTEARTVLAAQLSLENQQPFKMQLMRNEELVANWSKPPLYYWLVELSFSLFGQNETASRIPAFLSGLICLGFVFWLMRTAKCGEAGILAGLILISSGLFFFLMGISLLDMTLAAAVTASLSLLLRAINGSDQDSDRRWMMMSGVCCGLGMLTKGPVAAAIIAVTLGLFLLRRRRWKLLRRLNWISFINACLLTAVPGFMFVEYFNPGFLRYFFINENLLRYVVSEYGDLYGDGHQRAYGTSWLFLLVSFLPWTPIVMALLWRRFRNKGEVNESPEQRDTREFLLCWGLAPAVFFTFARQHLATYLLPGIPALAAFTALELESLQPFASAWFKATVKKISDYAAFGASLVLISAGIIAATSWVSPVLSLVCFAALMPILSWMIRSEESRVIVGSSALAITLTLAIGVISFGPYCRDFASTRDILQFVKNDLRFSGEVHFPVEVPSSAYLYSSGIAASAMPTGCSDRSICIIRSKDLKGHKEIRDSLRLLGTIGKWIVYTKL